ncbi:natterin-3-like [Drosophila tropicalis]|uniref:natterin-3-like n=1 Tax=Drosophila tropicalis TaxID=46794 RepID=UPI0035AC0AD7
MASWVQSSVNSPLPPNAFFAGQDGDGAEMFVGRAIFESEILPVKIVPRRREAYVTCEGGEYLVKRYEVLVGENYDWVASGDGLVPQNAISTGKDGKGQPIYVGRAVYKDTVTVGKVQPVRGCLILGYNGDEIEMEAYEVLVVKSP